MDRIEKLLQEMIEAQNSITFLAGKGEFGKAAKVIDQRNCLWNQIADDWRAMVEAMEEVEWAGENAHPFCPCCGGYKHLGHMDYCEVGNALAKIRGES